MKKEFKAESKQLLELMIHSIYSNKEVFLRELISNASDALDKRHYVSLQDQTFATSDLNIRIDINKEKRLLVITDTGIGMNDVDLDSNLGTIAHSGSKEFISQLNEEQTLDVIGQFGVGFYSSFIVADNVSVVTKKANDKGYKWISDGVDSYQVVEDNTTFNGTVITLHIKEGEEFDSFLDTNEVEMLVKKYSDFIKYPIMLEKTIKDYEVDEEGNTNYDKYSERSELQTINSMQALWKKKKTDITEEEYNNFYTSKFHDWQNPLKVIHKRVEGNLNYDMLLFIPSHKGFDFYSPGYQKQIDLYSKSVFIEGNCDYLVSDAFKFVKGIVDSDDLSLNISREMLQNDTNVSKLAKALESKIKSELQAMQRKNREDYEKFYDEFSQQLVYGLYDNYGAKKELLKDLVMFKSSKEEKYVTFKEYVERMPEGQEEIYYVSGSSIEQIKKLPAMEGILDSEKEILYFVNEVDEFAINVLAEYDGKKFKSINSADFTADESKKEEVEQTTKDNSDLLKELKDSLGTKVDDIIISTRLKNSAVCIVSKDGVSLEMEKTLAKLPDSQGVKATKVLEINADHELFKTIQKAYTNDSTAVKDYATILYNQALLQDGFAIEDPLEYTQVLTNLLSKA